MDNASIHKVPAKTIAKELDIEVIWNAAYRPDLNGIEFFWTQMKKLWRDRMTTLRVSREQWDQEALIQELVSQVGRDAIRRCAARGWRNLLRAEVVPALPVGVNEDLHETDEGRETEMQPGSVEESVELTVSAGDPQDVPVSFA